MEITIDPHIDSIVMPENLKVAAIVSAHRKMCETIKCDFDYYGFAFGQSPFPLPETLTRGLRLHADKGHYGPAEGIAELREAIAGFYRRHFLLDPDPSHIIVGPGSKSLIHAVFSIVRGGVIIPSPSWIGYLPLLKLLGKDYHIFHLNKETGYRITPDGLDRFMSTIPKGQHIFVLNNPHNPTGVVYSLKELSDIAAVLKKHKTLVLADEIYSLLTYEFQKFASMGRVYPDGTFITNGISKDRSAGGYRLGSLILPRSSSSKLTDEFKKLSATLYTNVSSPIQYAAVPAYLPCREVEDYFSTTRQIHRIMGHYVYEELCKIDGIEATKPEGGFYLFADFNALSPDLQKIGVMTSNDLGRTLLDHPHHIATITGDACLLEPDNFGARIAFVDYPGDQAYAHYHRNPPLSKSDEGDFVLMNAPQMVMGMEAFREFVSSVKNQAATKSQLQRRL